MAEIFIRVILGHLLGDYLLQSKKMALNKTAPGSEGLYWSIFHCLVYALSVCLFVFDFRPEFIFAVFLTHWPIDRFCLGRVWIRMIGGRDLHSLYYSDIKYDQIAPANIIDLAFGCIVYAVVDNTLHLLLLWVVILLQC